MACSVVSEDENLKRMKRCLTSEPRALVHPPHAATTRRNSHSAWNPCPWRFLVPRHGAAKRRSNTFQHWSSYPQRRPLHLTSSELAMTTVRIRVLFAVKMSPSKPRQPRLRPLTVRLVMCVMKVRGNVRAQWSNRQLDQLSVPSAESKGNSSADMIWPLSKYGFVLALCCFLSHLRAM